LDAPRIRITAKDRLGIKRLNIIFVPFRTPISRLFVGKLFYLHNYLDLILIDTGKKHTNQIKSKEMKINNGIVCAHFQESVLAVQSQRV
jgi:hypothetical protein